MKEMSVETLIALVSIKSALGAHDEVEAIRRELIRRYRVLEEQVAELEIQLQSSKTVGRLGADLLRLAA